MAAQEGDESMEHGEPPDTRSAPVGVKRGLPRLDLSEPLTPSLVPALIVGLTGVAGLAGIGVGDNSKRATAGDFGLQVDGLNGRLRIGHAELIL